MAKRGSTQKFQLIVDGAACEFAHAGYKRAQMSDIARTAGVALGTLYGYTKSKEALFFLALQRGFGTDFDSLWSQLDAAPPRPEDILHFVHQRCVETDHFPQLRAALEHERAGDARSELRTVVAELYDVIDRLHVAIRILDRSAREWPDLLSCFADQIRAPVVDRFESFFAARCERGDLQTPPDIPAAARGMLEICSTFAMHSRYSPGGRFTSDDTAREVALHFILNIFAPHAGQRLSNDVSGTEEGSQP